MGCLPPHRWDGLGETDCRVECRQPANELVRLQLHGRSHITTHAFSRAVGPTRTCMTLIYCTTHTCNCFHTNCQVKKPIPRPIPILTIPPTCPLYLHPCPSCSPPVLQGVRRGHLQRGRGCRRMQALRCWLLQPVAGHLLLPALPPAHDQRARRRQVQRCLSRCTSSDDDCSPGDGTVMAHGPLLRLNAANGVQRCVRSSAAAGVEGKR